MQYNYTYVPLIHNMKSDYICIMLPMQTFANTFHVFREQQVFSLKRENMIHRCRLIEINKQLLISKKTV